MEIFIYAVWTTGHRHVIVGSDDGALMKFHRRPIMVYTWVCMLQCVICIHVELGMYTDRIGSDRNLVGSDKNYRLSENPTIRSEVSNSILNKVHIANMRLTNSCEVKLIII